MLGNKIIIVKYVRKENLKIWLTKMTEIANWKIGCILLGFLLLCTNTHAQSYTVTGCTSDDTGYLYTGPAGTNSQRPGGYGPAYEVSPVVNVAHIGTGIYCSPVTIGNCVIRTRSQCPQCTGPYDYDPAKKAKDMYYEQAGKLKGYMACPIDDYIGLMLVEVGGLGFVMISKRFL